MCSVGGARGSSTSGEAFQQINSILDDLAGEDLNSLSAESMGDDQIALQRIVNRVQAEGLRRLRRFDGGQGYAPSGALSARAWLRWQLNLTANAASERVAISRRLAALPKTAQALADGDISYRHVASSRRSRASSATSSKPRPRPSWSRRPRSSTPGDCIERSGT